VTDTVRAISLELRTDLVRIARYRLRALREFLNLVRDFSQERRGTLDGDALPCRCGPIR